MKKFPKITHLIYDMDGVLLNTEPFYTLVTQKIAARYGKVFDWSVKSKMIGKRASDSARILTEVLGLPITPEEYLLERSVLLEELFRQVQPLPGARDLTEHLHQHGIPQAVGTSSERRAYEAKTSHHKDWFQIFECIVIGDDPAVQRGKPAPDIFLVAAERLDAEPKSCLVFEDSPAGVQGARAAGMWVIAVPDAEIDRKYFGEAHLVLESLERFDPAPWGLPPR
jgi:pseudouridine-5'-monophosphatase